ncbi:OsmC/Ohr family [Paraphoma chrysanthemicola]|uniref:OsmC/Ohr family n=1 Tax=Paraphoma chrysanthemicola TaxID=798071 RepID=A0A8K0RD02_9PLEO|nr:OsmC/Ohr family [Paraphoma chrysanthemicola]
MSAAQALREKQAPIKDGYRKDPSSAVVTLKSTGTLDDSSITCKLSDGPAVKEASRIAGLHQKAGGDDPQISGELCSGDMLLDALVACSGVTLKAVATALGIPIVSGTVNAEGDLDFKGTMGVDRNAPVGMTDIRLEFQVKFGEREDGRDVTEDEVEKLGKLTERYCVVLQTLVHKPKIAVRLAGGGKEEDGITREILHGSIL